MAKFKKGDNVSLKGSKAIHVIDVVSTSKRSREKAVTIYHISGTPIHRFYIADDLVKRS